MPVLQRWRARSRATRAADVSLVGILLLLTVALVVNSTADVHQIRRMQVDQRVMQDYLLSYAGGPGPFGHQPYVRVRRGHDLVCAFLRHGNGGICLHVVSTTTHSRKIVAEYTCVYAPPAPRHVKRYRQPPPPPHQHWCPAHPRHVI